MLAGFLLLALVPSALGQEAPISDRVRLGMDRIVFSRAAYLAALEQVVNPPSIVGTTNQISATWTNGQLVLALTGPYTPTTYTTNGVLYGAGAGAILATAQAPANSVLWGNAGAPSFTTSPTITTASFAGTSTGQVTSTTYAFSGDVLALGTAAQPDKLLVQLNSNTVYKVSYAASAFYGLARANGSFGSATALASGNVIGTLFFAGHDSSDITTTRGYVRGVAGEAWTSGVNGTYLAFGTTSSGSATVAERWRIGMNGGLSNTGAEPTTTGIKLKAGSGTAGTGPVEYTSGTIETTARAGLYEYDGNHRVTNVALLRMPLGGTLFDSYADVTVGGAEADIFTNTLLANTFNSNGDKVLASYGGNFVTVGTELTELRVKFAGTTIWDSTGVAPSTGTTSWAVSAEIIRVSSTVIRYNVRLNTTGASGYVYNTVGELTGLTLSGTNILKVTGLSSGVGSGSGDIVGKMVYVEFKGAA